MTKRKKDIDDEYCPDETEMRETQRIQFIKKVLKKLYL